MVEQTVDVMGTGRQVRDGKVTIVEVSTPGVGWSWGSTLTPNYGGLGGGGGVGTQQLSN